MRPSTDEGRSARDRLAEGFPFRDGGSLRPSPYIPRDGNSREIHNERLEQQSKLVDWDAASGLLEGDYYAYSAYLEPTGSGARLLEQNRSFHETLMQSTYFRAEDFHPTERETVTDDVNSRGLLGDGRTPAEYRLPREVWLKNLIAECFAVFSKISQILPNFANIFPSFRQI